jgi:predicted transcriptional regulator
MPETKMITPLLVAHNPISPGELPNLIAMVHRSFT